MKICVTGADGFVGQALCKFLEQSGYQVQRAVRRLKASNVVCVGNIDSNTNWFQALEGCETVVHLAAQVHVMQRCSISSLENFIKVNTEGTLNLARQAIEANVRRLVYVSTIKVNGEGFLSPHSSNKVKAYTESDLPSPQDAYAISKWKAEQSLLKLAHISDLEVVIIRPPLIYGPGVKGNFAALIKGVTRRIPLPFGSINNIRSLVALDNLIDFIALCADFKRSPKAANELFLISDGEDLSTTELLQKVTKAYKKNVWLIPIPLPWLEFVAKSIKREAIANRLLGSLIIDSSKARKLLGWRPIVTVDEQLQKMARYDSPV